jgi:predicted DNA-binding ArsR family transcriptional regulator
VKLKELMFDQMSNQWMTLAEIMTAAGRTKARPMPYDRQQIKALIEAAGGSCDVTD